MQIIRNESIYYFFSITQGWSEGITYLLHEFPTKSKQFPNGKRMEHVSLWVLSPSIMFEYAWKLNVEPRGHIIIMQIYIMIITNAADGSLLAQHAVINWQAGLKHNRRQQSCYDHNIKVSIS